jgi:hypothetical protein
MTTVGSHPAASASLFSRLGHIFDQLSPDFRLQQNPGPIEKDQDFLFKVIPKIISDFFDIVFNSIYVTPVN